MTQSQSIPESLRKSIQFLETQPGFHRDKVPGFKEAVENVFHLLIDEDFSVKLLKHLRQFQGFHIVQFSKIICLINKLCATSTLNFQSEVEKLLEVYQREEMAMDVSIFLEIVLDILSSEEATDNTVAALGSTMKEFDILYSELVGVDSVHLRETDDPFTSYNYHPSSSLLDCHHTIMRRFHKENGNLLIMATSSLICVEKSRQARMYSNNIYSGLILKAWVKLLRAPCVSNNLALLIAEMERNQYNAEVDLLDQQESNAKDQDDIYGRFPIILPEIVAAIDKLDRHTKDHEQDGDIVFRMMQVSGSFDTNLNSWTSMTVSRAEMEEKWKTLLKNAVQWTRFPVELTKLLLETSLTSKDFDLILRFSTFLKQYHYVVIKGKLSSDNAFVYLCNRIVNKKRSCTSTIAVVKFLMEISENEQSVYTCVINLLKMIDDLTEEKGMQADKRTTGFMRIYSNLHLLSQNHLYVFASRVSDDLVKCFLEKVPMEDLEAMANTLLIAAKNGIADPLDLWQVLVSIFCNKGISNKTGLWDKYLCCLSSTQLHQYGNLLPSEALGLLAEENAFLLLDQILSAPLCADFLSAQVVFFSRYADGDVNCHYSLVSSIIKGTAVNADFLERFERIKAAVISISRRSSIHGSVYDTLLAAVAGSVAVGTYDTVMDDHVSRCVAHALVDMPAPIEVISLYLQVKILLGRAMKSCTAFHGNRMAKMYIPSMMLCFEVSASDIWMSDFVQCAALLLSNGGSVSQRMSLLSKFYDAIFLEGSPPAHYELQNAVENFLIPVDQTESDVKRSLAYQLMKEVLDIPNILTVLGKIPPKEGEVSEDVRPPVVVPTKQSFVSLLLEKFPKAIETGEALEIYQFVSTLGNKNYLHVLLPVCLAVVENLTEVQDFLDELKILTSILMDMPSPLLPLAADCLATSYWCNMQQRQRKSFLEEVKQVEGIDMDVHILLKTSALFGKGWQKYGSLQRLTERLHGVLRNLDQANLSRCLTKATNKQLLLSMLQGGHHLGTAAKERDIFCEDVHWLLLETDLCPEDIALCINLSLPSFDSDCGMLQGRWNFLFSGDATDEDESVKSDEFTSPIRIVYTILLSLRRKFSVVEGEEYLLGKMFKAVFSDGFVGLCPSCSLRKSSFAARRVILDALNLLIVCKTQNELSSWLESPKLLWCGHAMNVVMEAFRWKEQEMEGTELENRMDLSRKTKTLLEKMMGFSDNSCVEHCSPDQLLKLLQLNLNHKLRLTILDLFLRSKNAALACGKIICNWQSVDEGLKLLKSFISLRPEERNLRFATREDFEFTHLALDVPLQLSLKSAEQVLLLWNQLKAQRELQEHYPLEKAAQWIESVSKSKSISPEILSSWLAIFRIAQSKQHDVDVITDLTPEVMDVLTPGSTWISDCLFSSEIVNKILLSFEKVDEQELKIALTLARLLNELSTLAKFFQKDQSPHSEEVMKILREASCELCKSFQDKIRTVQRDSGNHGRDSGIAIAGNAGVGSVHDTKHQRASKVSTKDLYKVNRHYQKKVFVQMSSSWGCHADSLFAGNKKITEGLLFLLRRWLATLGQQGNRKPVTKSHVEKIFNLVHHASRFPTKSQMSIEDEAKYATSSLSKTADRSENQFDCCFTPDPTSHTRERIVVHVPPMPSGRESADHMSAISPTTAAVAATGIAADAHVTVTVTSSTSKNVVTGWDDDLNSDACQSSCTRERSIQKPKAAPSSSEGHRNGHPSSAQVVQEYILNLDSNQACIARLQRAGYNRCDTLNEAEPPVNLWYDSCISLTGSISERQDNCDRKAKRQLKNLCNEYLDLLRNVEVQTVVVDGHSIPVRNLFAQKLSWDELTKQIDVVRENLQESLPQDERQRYQALVKQENEMRKNLKLLYSTDKMQTPQEGNVKRQDFTVLWENRFFEAIKLCSENIPGCYAPGGFHSQKPIQCALCADSRIISVFKQMGAHHKEVENVEVKLLEAGMFVYGLHSSQLEMDTDELWAAFYKYLLEKRLVPRIILTKDSPALDWMKQFVGAEGDEKLDASQMKFHETVIPKEESCYDDYPFFHEVDGKYVYSAALVLNSENVKQFVFSDIKVRDPSVTVTKDRGRKLTGEVIRELNEKLGEDASDSQRLFVRRLACAVQKVCDQVVKENLSETEAVKKNLEEKIDKQKLYKGIEGADEMRLEWFVKTIADLITEKSGPKKEGTKKNGP